MGSSDSTSSSVSSPLDRWSSLDAVGGSDGAAAPLEAVAFGSPRSRGPGGWEDDAPKSRGYTAPPTHSPSPHAQWSRSIRAGDSCAGWSPTRAVAAEVAGPVFEPPLTVVPESSRLTDGWSGHSRSGPQPGQGQDHLPPKVPPLQQQLRHHMLSPRSHLNLTRRSRPQSMVPNWWVDLGLCHP